LKQSIESKTIN